MIEDAIKTKCSEKGFALLQFNFIERNGRKYPEYSVQMPEQAVDEILQLIKNRKGLQLITRGDI